VRSAISGISARGIPKTIAMMSATNEASRIFCPARYLKPSTTSLNPARRDGPLSGGIDGSRHTANSVIVRATTSIR
jgi:hypothetical protein